MELLRFFPSEGGSEVNCQTDSGFFTVTKADFRRFCSEYTDADADMLINGENEDAKTVLPLHVDGEGEEEFLYLTEKLRALRYALYLLGISDKSTRQLLFKMKQKGFSERASQDAAAILMQNGRLSDEEFCRRKCELLALGKHYGRERIVRELAAKGIPAALCRRILDESDIDFDEQLRLLCEKLIREPIDTREERQKIIVKLMRYGYCYDEIADALSTYGE